jgi:homoaconitase/3-isopropylmalate dehydratase large subunit
MNGKSDIEPGEVLDKGGAFNESILNFEGRGLKMTMSMIEQIISNHSKDRVEPGTIVWMDIDLRTARDFGGANVVKNFQRYYPGEAVDDPSKTFFTFDTVVPAKTIPYAENQHTIRRFAREMNLKVFDVDMTGISLLYSGPERHGSRFPNP